MSSLQTSDSSFRGKLSKAKAEVEALESRYFFERPYYTFKVMETLAFRRHVLQCDNSPASKRKTPDDDSEDESNEEADLVQHRPSAHDNNESMSEHKLRIHKKSGIIYCFLCERTVRLDKVANHFEQPGVRKHNLPSAGDARKIFNSSLIQRLEQAGVKSYEDVLAFVVSDESVDSIPLLKLIKL